MNNTKIEWCDRTWNPVTGCLHGCEYCYARKIATRFGFHAKPNPHSLFNDRILESPAVIGGGKKCPYPFDFEPTFHKYRLDEPSNWTKPRTIFVCSMADLFGEWVPDDWIEDVFKACEEAPQHTYIFLTKNPKRYQELYYTQKLPIAKNMWFGATATDARQMKRAIDTFRFLSCGTHTFLSIEPIMCDISWESDSWIEHIKRDVCPPVEWVILGAETGNRKDKVVPQKFWISSIVFDCDKKGIPVFMKNSLLPIVGENGTRRELPWKT